MLNIDALIPPLKRSAAPLPSIFTPSKFFNTMNEEGDFGVFT